MRKIITLAFAFAVWVGVTTPASADHSSSPTFTVSEVTCGTYSTGTATGFATNDPGQLVAIVSYESNCGAVLGPTTVQWPVIVTSITPVCEQRWTEVTLESPFYPEPSEWVYQQTPLHIAATDDHSAKTMCKFTDVDDKPEKMAKMLNEMLGVRP
jgi:hypothetical protein